MKKILYCIFIIVVLYTGFVMIEAGTEVIEKSSNRNSVALSIK